jgi:hypothetical protein
MEARTFVDRDIGSCLGNFGMVGILISATALNHEASKRVMEMFKAGILAGLSPHENERRFKLAMTHAARRRAAPV